MVGSTVACQSQPVSITFDNETLVFPITVHDAVEHYKLSFNSPGYYYRKEATHKMSVRIDFRDSDYYNEHQSEEVLYNRQIVSYVLEYDGSKIESDSIKLKVERLCHCKLTFNVDSLSALRDPGHQPSIVNMLPQGGQHIYATAMLSQDLVVGFRNKPNYKGVVIPEVRFFYKQSPALIRHGMMAY